ncbi:ABC transporter ATP-binding protein [Streptomyces sp. SHP 1-2]|uniref:ABC transporter ATP-binding protein n=1 Tax=Streptomyces sp. SHP 1-2 TaxID=2769489 RepID=UPI0039E0FEDC
MRDGTTRVRRTERTAGGSPDPGPGRLPELLVLVCSLAAAAMAVAQPLVLGRALDLLLRGEPADHWPALSVALLTGEVLLDGLTALLTGRCTAGWTASVRSRALSGLLRAAPDAARPYTPGDTATRLTLNAADAGGGPAARAALAASLITPAGALAALVLVDLWVALCVLAGLPALALVLRVFARDTGASVRDYQQVQSDIAGRLLETLEGAETIAAAGTAPRERARVLAPLGRLSALGRRMWALHGRALATGNVLVPLLTLAATAVGGLRLGAGALSAGGLLAACRYAQLAAGLGGAATVLGALVRSRAARERTAELESLPALRHGTAVLPPDGPGTLELRGVRVLRGGTEVLRADAIVVPGGLTAAVVGRSGAGKSALAAVAGRLADPDAGEVLLDGVRLDALTREELRTAVGFAFARPVLGDGTVAGAVAAGARTAPPDRVREAVRIADADAFVRRLPDTYDTRLDEVPLSGGEHQRLGLARAFAHTGRLLVMDDATSSLDTATEHAVDRAMRRALGHATRLVVAHRPSVAARADLVIWLDGGRVRAVGPHERLWEQAGYKAVFATGTEGAAGAEGPHGAKGPHGTDGPVAAGNGAGVKGFAGAGAGGTECAGAGNGIRAAGPAEPRRADGIGAREPSGAGDGPGTVATGRPPADGAGRTAVAPAAGAGTATADRTGTEADTGSDTDTGGHTATADGTGADRDGDITGPHPHAGSGTEAGAGAPAGTDVDDGTGVGTRPAARPPRPRHALRGEART